MDVVFLDTTDSAIHRDEETEWRKRNCSKDKPLDLPQFVLGVEVDKRGCPVSWEVLFGNTADLATFEAMIAKMRTRFKIGRVLVVADPGMMGRTPSSYILGCRMRKQKEIGMEVLAQGRTLPGGRREPKGQGSPGRTPSLYHLPE